MSNVSFERNPDVMQRTVADEHLLVPVAGNLVDMDNLYVLDDVGLCVWNALAAPATVTALSTQVADVYEVDAQAAEADVRAFLENLVANGLAREAQARQGT